MKIKEYRTKFVQEKDCLKKLNIAREIMKRFKEEPDEWSLAPYYLYIIKNAHYPNWELDRASALLKQGTLEYKKSNFQIALEYLSESASIYKEHQDDYNYSRVMNNLAILYTATNQEEKALEIFQQIIKLSPNYPSILMNYANLLLKQGEADSALKLFQEAYKIAKNSNNREDLFTVIVELSNYYTHQNEADKSVELLLSIIKNTENISIRILTFAYLNLAEAYTALEKLTLALEWLDKALDSAQRSNIDELLWFSYIQAIKIYKKRENWEKAFLYSELRQALTEKIYLSKLKDKLDEIESGKASKLEKNSNESYNEKTIRMASLGVMASGITHEINQPLNAIMIDAQAMLYKDDQEKVLPIGYRDRIEYIIQATERITNIVNHIRFYWSPKNTVAKQELNVNEVISTATGYLQQQIKSHQIILKLIFTPENLKIHGSKISLEQIIINLLTNSIQALDNIDKKEKRIVITTLKKDDFALIEIDDNGSGIPPEIADKIFDPFITSKEEGYGTGLGLTLVQNFSKDLNAVITHSKNKFGGCRFTIKIPLSHTIQDRK